MGQNGALCGQKRARTERICDHHHSSSRSLLKAVSSHYADLGIEPVTSRYKVRCSTN